MFLVAKSSELVTNGIPVSERRAAGSPLAPRTNEISRQYSDDAGRGYRGIAEDLRPNCAQTTSQEGDPDDR